MKRKFSDRLVDFIGSWKFVVGQSVFLACWVLWNVYGPDTLRFDGYPFIFMNLALSFQAAYTAPIILMSANRQAKIDRDRLMQNLKLTRQDHAHLLELSKQIDSHFYALHLRLDGVEPEDASVH